MNNVAVFIWLMFVHFIADWVFQTHDQATNKTKNWKYLLSHCLVYTAFFIIPFFIFKINLLWLIAIFLVHVILDKRSFLVWIMKNIKKITLENVPEHLYYLLIITIDQIFHLLLLWIIVVI
jgi:hypothetical protein